MTEPFIELPDHEKLPAWLRDAADEIENAHRALDTYAVPRKSPDGTPRTLAARIATMASRDRRIASYRGH